jgi:hypothetical protein
MNISRLYYERLCPACGYMLEFRPWQNNVAAEKPCPCCGLYFGHDDADESRREAAYHLWRQRWVAGGRRWWAPFKAPRDYNPTWQLARLEALEILPRK